MAKTRPLMTTKQQEAHLRAMAGTIAIYVVPPEGILQLIAAHYYGEANARMVQLLDAVVATIRDVVGRHDRSNSPLCFACGGPLLAPGGNIVACIGEDGQSAAITGVLCAACGADAYVGDRIEQALRDLAFPDVKRIHPTARGTA